MVRLENPFPRKDFPPPRPPFTAGSPAATRGDRRQNGGASTSVPTRRGAADKAGLSKDQQTTAVRLANVPADELEAAAELDEPPPVTARENTPSGRYR